MNEIKDIIIFVSCVYINKDKEDGLYVIYFF